MQCLFENFAEKDNMFARIKSRKMQCRTNSVQMLEFPFEIIKIS